MHAGSNRGFLTDSLRLRQKPHPLAALEEEQAANKEEQIAQLGTG